MAAPEYVPPRRTDRPRYYTSPDHVPAGWKAERPGDLPAGQPVGARLGRPGPDQGYGLKLARRFVDRLQLAPGEHVEDAVHGCLGVALRRASTFGRAPTIHDLELAYRIWGFLGDAPPELVELRSHLFGGVASPHHYQESRQIVDRIPDATLRMTHEQVRSAFPARWRELVGA